PALNAAVDGLDAHGHAALWDGIRHGLALFDEAPDLRPNMLVIAGGRDTASTETADTARAGALDAGAAMFVVGLEGNGIDEGALKSLARDAQGTYVGTRDPAQLSTVVDGLHRSITNQYEITYQSTAKTPTIDLAV